MTHLKTLLGYYAASNGIFLPMFWVPRRWDW